MFLPSYCWNIALYQCLRTVAGRSAVLPSGMEWMTSAMFCFLILAAVLADQQTTVAVDAPIEELIESRGYKLDEYEVTTEDGYILKLHRIKSKRDSQEVNSDPVLLQHGLMHSSACFMTIQNCMAFYLVDRGYDVWMSNSRGNLYGRRHRYMDASDSDFWDFSFHEIALYDLPKVLDHISAEVGGKKIHYYGVSMGTTVLLVLGASRPDYLDKLGSIVLAAPVARPTNMNLLKNRFTCFVGLIGLMSMKAFHKLEVYPQNTGSAALFRRLCTWMGDFCLVTLMKTIVPLNKEECRMENSVDNLRYFPAGAALKIYSHYFQIAKTGKFRPYSHWSKEKNRKEYGTSTPPDYDLSRINKKIYMIYGGADRIAAPKDVLWLKKRLPQGILVTSPFEKYSHRGFLFGLKQDEDLFPTVDRLFREESSLLEGLHSFLSTVELVAKSLLFSLPSWEQDWE